jgi:hypothetical protein
MSLPMTARDREECWLTEMLADAAELPTEAPSAEFSWVTAEGVPQRLRALRSGQGVTAGCPR